MEGLVCHTGSLDLTLLAASMACSDFGENTDYRIENRRAGPSEVAGGQRQAVAGPPIRDVRSAPCTKSPRKGHRVPGGGIVTVTLGKMTLEGCFWARSGLMRLGAPERLGAEDGLPWIGCRKGATVQRGTSDAGDVLAVVQARRGGCRMRTVGMRVQRHVRARTWPGGRCHGTRLLGGGRVWSQQGEKELGTAGLPCWALGGWETAC